MSNVLIVEDDPLMLRMYRRIFTLEGFTVDSAENGQLGLDRLNSTKPDIVLIDIMMPVMNGLELLKKMKADPSLQRIPAIMLTNVADVELAEEAMALGAVRYVVKSNSELNEIVTIVRNIIAGSSATAQTT